MRSQLFRKLSKNVSSDRNFSSLKPGRSMVAPPLKLKASLQQRRKTVKGFLSSSVGRNGANFPADLEQLGMHLEAAGMAHFLVERVLSPANNGTFIARYQREVLNFSRPDGRIDPGGKTLKAMLNLQGREIVKSWFTKGAQAEAKEVENTAKKGKKAASLQNAGGKGRWLIAPVLEKGDYLTQAPPWLAQHKQTMSKEKLFRFALAKYGPSGTKDISNEEKVKKSWKNKSYQERLEKVYWIGCMNTCVSMLESVGASPDFSKAISTITEDLKSKNVKGNGNLKNGVSIIEKNLKGGKPVVMGVHKNFKRQNYDATDHFVVAVGIWQEGEKIAIAYFDPGTGRPSGWDVSKNLIWIDQKNKMAIDEKNYGSSQYILSRVTDNQ